MVTNRRVRIHAELQVIWISHRYDSPNQKNCFCMPLLYLFFGRRPWVRINCISQWILIALRDKPSLLFLVPSEEQRAAPLLSCLLSLLSSGPIGRSEASRNYFLNYFGASGVVVLSFVSLLPASAFKRPSSYFRVPVANVKLRVPTSCVLPPAADIGLPTSYFRHPT